MYFLFLKFGYGVKLLHATHTHTHTHSLLQSLRVNQSNATNNEPENLLLSQQTDLSRIQMFNCIDSFILISWNILIVSFNRHQMCPISIFFVRLAVLCAYTCDYCVSRTGRIYLSTSSLKPWICIFPGDNFILYSKHFLILPEGCNHL